MALQHSGNSSCQIQSTNGVMYFTKILDELAKVCEINAEVWALQLGLGKVNSEMFTRT